MCLAIPAKVIELADGDMATVALEGVKKRSSVALLEDVTPGDYVLVHVGYAIQKLEPEEAAATWQVLDELFESNELEEADPEGAARRE